MDAPDPLKPDKPAGGISKARIVVYVVMVGVGLYLVISGILSIVAGN